MMCDVGARDDDRISHVRIGVAIREQRMTLGRRQVDVSDECAVSTTRICRMELGVGEGIALGAWLRVCSTLGLELGVQAVRDPLDDEREDALALVASQADAGEWAWARTGSDMVMLRPARREVMVVRVWPTVGDVPGMT